VKQQEQEEADEEVMVVPEDFKLTVAHARYSSGVDEEHEYQHDFTCESTTI